MPFVPVHAAKPVKAPSATAPRYILVDRGLAGDDTVAVGLNEAGDIAADYTLWSKGKKIDLGAGFKAVDINDKGQVLGNVPAGGEDFIGKPLMRGVVWEGGKRTYLPDNLRGVALNNRGVIVMSDDKGGYLWENNQRRTLTGKGVDGEYPLSAVAINEKGQVASESGSVWDRGNITELADLYPQKEGPAESYSRLTGINSTGIVCGLSSVSGPGSAESPAARTACIWDKGKPVKLEELGKREDCVAEDINDSGQVVGTARYAYTEREEPRAVLWQKGKAYDLNLRLGQRRSDWVLQEAFAINNKGQIAGIGTYRKRRHFFLLTPVD